MKIDIIAAILFGTYVLSLMINLVNIPLFYKGTAKIVLAMTPIANTIAATIILSKGIYRGFKEIMED